MAKNDGMNSIPLPLLATAALQGSGTNNEQLQELVGMLLKEQLAGRDKDKAKKERLALNAIQATKDATDACTHEQARCSHTKQDNTSRLSGQYLSGTGQLCLVCLYCQKEFHMPPYAGQEAAPRHLIPSADVIGG